MMDIAILGTGRVGRTLAEGLKGAGHDVVMGSRTPTQDSVAGASVKPLPEAAGGAEFVVNAVPGSVALDTLRGVGKEVLAGRILVDVANALNDRFELLYPNSSLGATLQNQFPATRVVKTLNTVSAPVMTNPGSIGPTNVFLSGDDETAKASVRALLEQLGWQPESQIDLGDISTARATEHYIYLSMAIMRAVRSTTYGIGIQTRR
jgi:predicted dinucleotide-binding enzyme